MGVFARGLAARPQHVLLVAAAAVLISGIAGASPTARSQDDEHLEGRAPTPIELEPGVVASFSHESYAPGSTARLVIQTKSSSLRLQLFHAGPEEIATVG